MPAQTTLNATVHALGVGLHSGNLIRMTLKSAPPDSGIVFRRRDLGGVLVPATLAQVDFSMLRLATCLQVETAEHGTVRVKTVEHLLSALHARGVDNVLVELDGPEVPILDGSSAPILYLIDEAGIRLQSVPRRLLRIVKPFHFTHNDKKMSALPSRNFKVTYEIHFDHPLIQRQKKTLVVTPETYEKQIARARTFGFLKDVNHLKKLGMIQGGSIDNAIVLDGERMLNDALRLEDEFVSHKILDLVGDLAISGFRLQGHFMAYKAGHEVHARFLRELLAAEECYVVEGQIEKAPFVPFTASSLENALASF